jgi:hypothetical protein
LMRIMTRKGKDEVIDCATQANGGRCQVTFADMTVGEDGKPRPVETVLSGEEDLCTCQCLDYILLINRNKDGKYDKASIINNNASSGKTSRYSINRLNSE